MNRLALYFTPDPDSALAIAAATWLGRDIFQSRRNRPADNSVMPLPLKRMEELTEAPFHYGFHGTIKPPFRLIPGTDIQMVSSRLKAFSEQQTGFVLPSLEIGCLFNFFCLRPSKPSSRLQELAKDAVRFFDEFRLPAGPEEIAKRRNTTLSPRQDALLLKWGYPYVMEEFRFHLTLTGTVTNDYEKTLIHRKLQTIFPAQLLRNVPINSLSLFIERERQPFVHLQTYAFS